MTPFPRDPRPLSPPRLPPSLLHFLRLLTLTTYHPGVPNNLLTSFFRYLTKGFYYLPDHRSTLPVFSGCSHTPTESLDLGTFGDKPTPPPPWVPRLKRCEGRGGRVLHGEEGVETRVGQTDNHPPPLPLFLLDPRSRPVRTPHVTPPLRDRTTVDVSSEWKPWKRQFRDSTRPGSNRVYILRL